MPPSLQAFKPSSLGAAAPEASLPSSLEVSKPPVELAVIVPTFNERENVPLLVERLETALGHLEWELVYVDDDSPDGTSAKVRELSQVNPRVRCVQRIGRRG